MEFGLTQEQSLLRNEVRRFLKNECPKDFVKETIEGEIGFSPPLWKKMADLGWMGLLFEEKYGGTGGTFLDLCIVLEEMGRFLVPAPFFSTVVLGGVPIAQGGEEELKQRFLPGIARGDIIVTTALTEVEGNCAIDEIESNGERREDGFVLRGKKIFVSDAHIANCILCPARAYPKGHPSEVSLLIIDTKSQGIEITPLITLDLKKQFEMSFTDVYVPRNRLVGQEGQGGTLIQNLWPLAVAGKCCEMIGVMQRVLEMTLSYVQERRQFGRPLSAFQVIQHYCADMAIDLECSRVITNQAAWRVSNSLPSRKEVAMAKAWCSESLKEITTKAHQIYGAIGFTKEYDLYLFFRYAKVGEITFRDANFHKEVVAAEMEL